MNKASNFVSVLKRRLCRNCLCRHLVRQFVLFAATPPACLPVYVPAECGSFCYRVVNMFGASISVPRSPCGLSTRQTDRQAKRLLEAPWIKTSMSSGITTPSRMMTKRNASKKTGSMKSRQRLAFANQTIFRSPRVLSMPSRKRLSMMPSLTPWRITRRPSISSRRVRTSLMRRTSGQSSTIDSKTSLPNAPIRA